jgi:hypothetical protein
MVADAFLKPEPRRHSKARRQIDTRVPDLVGIERQVA